MDAASAAGTANMFRADHQRSGSYRPFSAPAGNNAWTFRTGMALLGSPAIHENQAFIGSMNGFLYAIDLKKMSVEWKVSAGARIHASPRIVNGRIYFGDMAGTFHALELDGTELWRLPTGAPISHSACAKESTLFFANAKGTVYAVDWASGGIEWTHDNDRAVIGPPVVAGSEVFFSSDGCVSALDTATGKPKWQVELSAPSPPVFNAGMLYVSSLGVLHAIQPADGAIKWTSENCGFGITPAIDGNWAYVTDPMGDMCSIDLLSGKKRWVFECEQEFGQPDSFQLVPDRFPAPCMSNTLAFYATWVDYVYALDRITGALVWKLKIKGRAPSTLVLSGDDLHFGTFDGWFYSVNAQSGKLNSRVCLGLAIASAPALSDGRVFFGSDASCLYAATEEGMMLWKYETAARVRGAPAVEGQTVFFGSDDGIFHAVETEDGTAKWTFSTGESIVSSPLVKDGRVMFGSGDGVFYCLDARDGGRIFTFEAGAPIVSSPCLSAGAVCFASDRYLYAIDASTGRRRWRFELPADSECTPAASETMVYLGDSEGNVHAVNLSTGEKQWSARVQGPIAVAVALSTRLLHFGDASGRLYAMNRETGRIMWEFVAGGAIRCPPSVCGEWICFGSDDGVLHILNARTGKLVKECQVDDRITTAAVPWNGKILFGTSAGHLIAIQ